MTTKIACLFVTLLLLINSKFLSAQDSTIVPGNIIVMLHSEKDTAVLMKALSLINGINSKVHLKSTLSKRMHIYLLEFDHLSVDQQLILNMALSNPLVKIAQYNHSIKYRKTINVPNDTLFNHQWNMYNNGSNRGKVGADIDAINAWSITTGGLSAQGDTIVVAVVDQGFDLLHKDLNFWVNHHEIPHNHIDDDKNGYVDDYYGWDPQKDNDNLPVIDHGTHVCGIAGAKGNNTTGVAGVNWNVKIMAVSTDGSTESNVVACYSYVMEQRRIYNKTNGDSGAFVVSTNSSFGINEQPATNYPLWCAMYDSLGSVGILSAAATADENYNVDSVGDIPTTCLSNWLVTVTNTTHTDAKSLLAAYGAKSIDLSAPGDSIASTLSSNRYGLLSGTSMSSPHVAGAIALIYSIGLNQFITDYKSNPAAVALMVKDSLLKAVDTLPSLKGITVSGGRLNVYKALMAIISKYPNDTCKIDPIIGTGTLPAVGIETYTISSSFELLNTYPNPTSNSVTAAFNSTESCATLEATFTNIFGQTVKTISIATTANGVQSFTTEVGALAAGVYLLQLNSCNGIRSNVIKMLVY